LFLFVGLLGWLFRRMKKKVAELPFAWRIAGGGTRQKKTPKRRKENESHVVNKDIGMKGTAWHDMSAEGDGARNKPATHFALTTLSLH